MKGSDDLILIYRGISIELKPMFFTRGKRGLLATSRLSPSTIQHKYCRIGIVLEHLPAPKTKGPPQPQYRYVSYLCQDQLLTLALQPLPLPSHAFPNARGKAWLFRHLASWILYQGYFYANFQPESIIEGEGLRLSASSQNPQSSTKPAILTAKKYSRGPQALLHQKSRRQAFLNSGTSSVLQPAPNNH